jgi:hypothetical protein
MTAVVSFLMCHPDSFHCGFSHWGTMRAGDLFPRSNRRRMHGGREMRRIRTRARCEKLEDNYWLGARYPVLAYTMSGGTPFGGFSLTLIFRHVPSCRVSLGLYPRTY